MFVGIVNKASHVKSKPCTFDMEGSCYNKLTVASDNTSSNLYEIKRSYTQGVGCMCHVGWDVGLYPGTDQRHPHDSQHLPLLQHIREDDVIVCQGLSPSCHQIHLLDLFELYPL